jgi:hypothetical protein
VGNLQSRRRQGGHEACRSGCRFALGHDRGDRIGRRLLGAIAALEGPEKPSSAPSGTTASAASTTVSTVASLTWTTAPPSSAEEPAHTLRIVPPSRYARHYRIGARCRDGWRSHATGSGACSWHGGVAEWLYADDRVVHDTKTGREIGTVKSVGTYAGRALQRQASYGLSLDEIAVACERTLRSGSGRA